MIGVFFSDGDLVNEIKVIFEKWRADATEYHNDTHPLKWYERLSLPIIWVLFPFI
jgi:hypothetical protein